MAQLHKEIAEKRKVMREIYGGMMSAEDLHRELGMKPEVAKAMMMERGFGCRVGRYIKFETDMVAKFIVERRGMA